MIRFSCVGYFLINKWWFFLEKCRLKLADIFCWMSFVKTCPVRKIFVQYLKLKHAKFPPIRCCMWRRPCRCSCCSLFSSTPTRQSQTRTSLSSTSSPTAVQGMGPAKMEKGRRKRVCWTPSLLMLRCDFGYWGFNSSILIKWKYL